MINLDLIILNSVVFPGVEIPLRLRPDSHSARAIFKAASNPQKLCGIIYRAADYTGNSIGDLRSQSSFNEHGTTVEISVVEVDSQDHTLVVKLKAISIFALRKLDHSQNLLSCEAILMSDGPLATIHSRPSTRPFPPWVYQQFLPETLSIQALEHYSLTWKAKLVPFARKNPLTGRLEAEENPEAFSFHLCNNVFVNKKSRLAALALTTVERLLHCISALKEDSRRHTILACSACGLGLASRRSMFSVSSAQGSCGVYTNPHGVLHQTVTVSDLLPSKSSAPRVLLEGRPTARDTWFDGFAWTIAYCARCDQHLGWKFETVQLYPWMSRSGVEEAGETFFYGFRFDALQEYESIGKDDDDESNDDAEESSLGSDYGGDGDFDEEVEELPEMVDTDEYEDAVEQAEDEQVR